MGKEGEAELVFGRCDDGRDVGGWIALADEPPAFLPDALSLALVS